MVSENYWIKKEIQLPENVLSLIDVFTDADVAIYVVGGAVRDYFLGREVRDWDMAVASRPEKTKRILRGKGIRFLDYGEKYGTVTAVMEHEMYELTTFRKEEGYGDLRHPDKVDFVSDISADLSRRDFTVNAMAYSPYAGIFDPLGGLGDIEAGLIRAAGNPGERLAEDPLRILRGIRFASELGFVIEENTLSAMKENFLLLETVSRERIRDEIYRTIGSRHPDYGLGILCNSGHPDILGLKGCRKEFLVPLKLLPGNPELRLAYFLHEALDGEKSDCREWLREMRFPARAADRVFSFFAFFGIYPETGEDREIKKKMAAVGYGNLEMYKAVQEAKGYAHDNLQLMEDIRVFYRKASDILQKGEPVYREDLRLAGSDLIATGFPAGEEIGMILEKAYEYVLENPRENKKEILLSRIRERRIMI